MAATARLSSSERPKASTPPCASAVPRPSNPHSVGRGAGNDQRFATDHSSRGTRGSANQRASIPLRTMRAARPTGRGRMRPREVAWRSGVTRWPYGIIIVIARPYFHRGVRRSAAMPSATTAREMSVVTTATAAASGRAVSVIEVKRRKASTGSGSGYGRPSSHATS